MVNPYTDPRYAMARLMRNQSSAGPVSANPLLQGPAPSQGAIRLGRAANDAALNNPSLRQQIEAISKGNKPSGPKGIAGAVLGNPVAKVGLGALGTLAIPGRAVVAGIREVADILDDDPNTRASFSDLKKNVMDPRFGFGTAFNPNTGNKWLDRAIGFVGDVALDPLTYATFGAGKFAGYSGRLKLATEVLKNTGDNALATAVARTGRAALRNNPEVLERVGANKFGVYFFGKRLKVGPEGKGIRVPMSGQIAQIGESTLAKLRLAATDTRAGKYVQKLTMPKDMLDARLKLARGLVSPEEGADYVRFFEMVPRERAARATALQAFEQEVLSIVKSEELGGLETYRKNLHKFLENPELLETASEAERRGYEVWKSWFDKHAQNIQAGIKSVDPEANIEMRQNYFPRTLTDDALRYTRGDGVYSEKLREVFMNDPFAKPGAFTPRSLGPGKPFFDKILTVEDMSVENLNKIAREAGFEGDFFETDIVEAARKYIYDAADEIGIIERNKVLVESNFFKRLEDQRVTKLEVDEDAVAMARQQLADAKGVLDGADEEFRKGLAGLADSVRAEAKAVGSQVVTQEAGVANISRYLFDSKERIAGLGRLIDDTKLRITQMMGDPSEIMPYALSDDFPSVAKPILEQFDSIAQEVKRYERLIDDAYQEVSNGRVALSAMDDKVAELEEASARAFAAYSEAKESIESAMEFSNVLQANWDAIVVGGNLGGSDGHYVMLKAIKDVLETSSVTPTGAAKKRAQAVGVAGGLKDFLRGTGVRSDSGKYFDDVFAELSGAGGVGQVKRTNVDMTQKEFLRRMNNALSEDISINQLREAALYAIGRDIRLYNAKSFDDLPDVVKEFHTSLRKTLSDATEVERFRASMSKTNRLGELESLERRLGATHRKAMSIVGDIKEYDNFLSYMDNIFSSSAMRFSDDVVDVIDRPLTDDTIASLEHAVADMSSTVFTEEATGRALTWLYDYVDNPELMLGKAPGETPTLREVVEAIRDRRQKTAAAFEGEKISISDPNLKVGTELGGVREVTYPEVIQMFRTAQNESVKGLRVNQRILDKAMNPEVAKVELAKNLLTYEGISNAVVKFEAVAGILASHGLVPTEDMWRGILRTVSSQYGPQFKTKINQTVRAKEVLQDVRQMFSQEMELIRKLPKEEQIAPGLVFEGALKKALDSPDGPAIREVIGSSLGSFYDPYDMRRRIKSYDSNVRNIRTSLSSAQSKLENTTNPKVAASLREQINDLNLALSSAKDSRQQYIDDFIIPWAKMVDPSRRAQAGPALQVLKSKVGLASKKDIKELASPLSREVNEIQINNWFSDLFGSERNITDVWDIVGGNADTTVQNGTLRIRGSIDSMQKQYVDAMRFFDRMNDGYLDVAAFFNNPAAFQRTPSAYSAIMDNWASELESVLASSDKARQVVSGRARVETERAAKAASSEEAKALRAQQVVEAFRNPDLTSEDLKAMGFTKAMVTARDAVLEHNAHRATLEFAKATQDQEMVSFLDAVSGVDFSKFTDGIVVDVQRMPIYQDSAQRASQASSSATLESINKNIDDLRSSLEDGRNQIIRKHQNPDGTWKSPQSANYADIELQQWNSTYGRRIERRISALEVDAEDMSQRVSGTSAVESTEPVGVDANGRVIIGYEEQPVWATMPDGSRLVFTPDEWDSLYQKPLVALEAKQLRSRAREIEKIIKNTNDVLNLRMSRNLPVERLRNLKSSVESLKSELSLINRRLNSSTTAVRNSALEKVRILTTKQNGESKVISSWINEISKSNNVFNGIGRSDFRRLATKDPTTVNVERVAKINGKTASASETLDYYFKLASKEGKDAWLGYVAQTLGGATGRRAGLQEMWEKNPSYAVLQRDAELAKAAASESYRDKDKTFRMLNKAAREARKHANDTASEFDVVERTIRESIQGMRSGEFGAARAAGAQFEVADDLVDFAESIGAPVSYTLNGKQYTIPSLEQMLKNPDKYVRQARKRGDFFFDLRQKGNVAMWRDMDENARAVAATAALKTQFENTIGTVGIYNFNVIQPTVARVREVEGLIKAWSGDVNTLRQSLDSVREALNAERALLQSDVAEMSEELVNARLDFFELGEEIRSLYGADFDINMDNLGRLENRLSTLKSQQKMFDNLAQSAPSKRSANTMLDAKRPATRERWRDVYQDWVDENRETLRALAEADLNNPGERAVWNAWMQAQTAEARFIREQASVSAAQKQLDTASAGVMVEKVIKPFEKEFSKVAKEMLSEQNLRMAGDLNMPSFAVNQDVMRVLNNLSRAREGAMVRELGRFMGQYTSFFKAYATLTPGFHVRNTISNTFQLFAAGASPIEMSRGLKLYRSMGEFIRNGGTYENWLKTLPENVRAQARIAGDVTLGLGGGNVDDAFREFANIGRGRLVDNIATRTSRKFGHRVEGSARFMLAWDSAVRGDDFVESFNRTKRFLFDYNDPTILDETVRNVVPFWTWMSRNLPLQIVNQWANPKPYLIYQKFANNFGAGENDVLPSYMSETGHSIKLGSGLFLSPDLPHSRIRGQVEDMLNPTRLMSYVNPGLRVPVELMGGRKTFNNAPFTGEYKPVTGQYLPFLPLLQALGQVEYTQDGKPVMTDKAQYALTSMLPMVGQAERLFPTSDSGDGMALARYIGLPLRRVDEDAENRIKLGRLAEIQALNNKNKKIEEAYGD